MIKIDCNIYVYTSSHQYLMDIEYDSNWDVENIGQESTAKKVLIAYVKSQLLSCSLNTYIDNLGTMVRLNV